jgi:hypothetical protein
MALTATSPARGEAAGLGKSSCLGADDSRVSTVLPYRNQAVDRARRRYLVARLHALRPAPFAYLLREIEAGADVRSKSAPRCLPNLSVRWAAIDSRQHSTSSRPRHDRSRRAIPRDDRRACAAKDHLTRRTVASLRLRAARQGRMVRPSSRRRSRRDVRRLPKRHVFDLARDIGRKLSPQEVADCKARAEADHCARKAADAKIKAEARETAARIWNAAAPAPDDHAYLVRKNVTPHGLRVHERRLVVPMRDSRHFAFVAFYRPGWRQAVPGRRPHSGMLFPNWGNPAM